MDHIHFDFNNEWGKEIRNRYVQESLQHINGKALKPEAVKTRTMNFGQHWRTGGIISYPYEVRLPIHYVIDFINALLPEYNKDAQEVPDKNNELDQLLADYNWSEDAKFLLNNTTKSVQQLLLDYFALEMLLHWYTDAPVSENGCVINTHDKLMVIDSFLVIQGLCRKPGISVQHQDE